jgi:hypothetical protein
MAGTRSSPKGTRGNRQLSPRGCLLILLGAWAAWVLVDLLRLGVFSGARRLPDALLEMPSLGLPLFLLVGLSPLAARLWWEARRKKAFPKEPWMWERAWDRLGARSTEPARLGAPLAFAVLLTLVCAMLVLVARTVARSDVLLLALSPFYAVTLGVWVWWGWRAARVFRLRGPYFRYARFPYFLGERLQGDLEVQGLDEMTRGTLTLRCVRERRGDARQRRRVSRETVHEELREISPASVAQRPVGSGADAAPGEATRPVLPVRFDLPDGDLATRLCGDPVLRWELHARLERPGLDLEATFLVPVYGRRPTE